MTAPQSDPAPAGSLATKIQTLQQLKRKRPEEGEGVYSVPEIAEGASRLYIEQKKFEIDSAPVGSPEHQSAVAALDKINEKLDQGKQPIQASYLRELRSGKRTNPTKDVIQALASFFRVSPAYFFSGADATPETREAEAEIEMMLAAQNLFRRAKESGMGTEELMVAMRGAGQLNPQKAMGVIRVLSAAIEAATPND
ncbi:hypothetical protein E6R60_26905 [Streptomyces sp. A0642]|uniref:hypothetical protein n=1 Tax=Streptomyces sp. A0642 TaxID=2563100 RepID=UPI0010A28998|nr:hypothetical protein [Streptomyces sp. A0642]THA72561.1 hypothetical protein E6R60_26905 [Streptomyces sp. A0642]